MSKNRKNNKGFTLTELIIVFIIIAIAAGIAIPVLLKWLPLIRINGAARQIMGDLMWARMRAISENNNYIIVFGTAGPDISNNTYYIYDDDENDFNSSKIDSSELVKAIVIPEDYKGVRYGYVTGVNKTDNETALAGLAVKFGSTGTSKRPIWFKFQPSGRPNVPGSIYLILEEDLKADRKDRMRVLTVATPGRVKIWKYDAEGSRWK